ncbi:hypothetical protein Q3G72_016546 [Acer saccharum]|nr:hypothetical protein Q3G72_016546 [Acer saccharum]
MSQQYHGDIENVIPAEIAAAGRNEFVKQLVSKYQKDEALEMKNYEENMEFVLLMLEKNMELPMIRNIDEKLPVQMAALLGHEEM